MELIILIAILILIIVLILMSLKNHPITKPDLQELQNSFQELHDNLSKVENSLQNEFRVNREESAKIAKDNRSELNDTLKEFRSELSDTLKNIIEQNQNALREINKSLNDNIDALIKRIKENDKENRDSLVTNFKEFSQEQKIKFEELKGEQKDLSNITVTQLEKITNKVETKLSELVEQSKIDSNQNRESLEKAFKGFQDTFDKNVSSFNELQKEKFAQLENKQNELVKGTESKLESIRTTVEEKLEKTLSDRLGQSFETVGKQLNEVQKGLGEMQTLAQDVGGLKKVLSNVKMRGGFGEIQLEMLLEQILAPDQYKANVKTNTRSEAQVEFAIKLPGKDENGTQVWLPIDAKFPKDGYEQLQNAYENGDPLLIEQAQKTLENSIKKMAKDICDKYIDPPNTTDFAIMFLPFEGIYAEVVRKASLLEELQRTCKVIVTGPTTLAAILNSLQMGFKTLAIQKRSSEVWKVLGAVKKEFENFGGIMQKAQKNIQTGLNHLDDVIGKRTKAIQQRLKGVETLNESETKLILPEISESVILDDENEN